MYYITYSKETQMAKATGIYETKLKNGTASFRVSITYKGKHISLGSYPDISTAENIYSFGKNLIESDLTLENYSKDWSFPHDKYVTLINFRDNGIYFPTPIYLRKQLITKIEPQAHKETLSIPPIYQYSGLRGMTMAAMM